MKMSILALASSIFLLQQTKLPSFFLANKTISSESSILHSIRQECLVSNLNQRFQLKCNEIIAQTLWEGFSIQFYQTELFRQFCSKGNAFDNYDPCSKSSEESSDLQIPHGFLTHCQMCSKRSNRSLTRAPSKV